MTSLSKPFRLSLDLYEEAEKESKPLRRSTPKQIEYWAALGHKIERFLSVNDVIAIEQGLAKITLSPETVEPLEVDTVFASLQEDIDSGTFMDSVRSKGDFIYEASATVQGMLDKVLKSGERITGKLVNGQFVPL